MNPTWVKLSASILEGTDVNVCSVIGFPLGANTPESKTTEKLYLPKTIYQLKKLIKL